ncbi:hypothetical protein [uncultured Eubacterium sp.]|uniref:portal protein n=1 Tax=uncultured Eubacterium sp. TaxID=165185 RepID=UPI00259A6810|nr:hypothetical protein [uncultured Eubacterium sp.]
MADFERYNFDELNKSDDFRGGETVINTDVVTKETILKANGVLERYKEGKASLENRIKENEQWWRQRHWDIMVAKDEAGNPNEIKPTSAWLFNCMMAKYSDYMESYPMPNILPRAADDEKEAKRLSEIIPVILEQANFEKTYSDEQWYKLKTGTSVYGVFWNGTKNNGLGDIDIKKIELLNLYWEPGIHDIQESSNVFLLSLVNRESINASYPELVNVTLPNGTELSDYQHDDPIDNSDKVLVVEWYYKKVNSQGNVILHYCKYTGDYVLYASENMEEYKEVGYYNHALYPFVFETMFPIESSICGLSYIDICKEPQKYIDRLNQVALKLALLSKPRAIVRDDVGLNQEEFTDAENDLLHANGNLNDDNFRWCPIPEFNSALLSLMDAKINEMKDTTGNTDVSNGSGVPSGITAASAIAAMQEAAGKTSRSQIKTSWRSYKDIIYIVIELIRQFYNEPRQFRIMGDDGQMNFVDYDNSKIAPQAQGVDFEMDMGFRLPLFDIEVSIQKNTTYNRMEQNELAINFYNMGLFNPQMSDQALACLDIMDFDHKDKVIEKVQQNGTMFEQLQQMQMQIAQLSALLAQATGGEINPMGEAAMNGAAIAQPMPSGDGMISLDGTNEGGTTERAREQQNASITPR